VAEDRVRPALIKGKRVAEPGVTIAVGMSRPMFLPSVTPLRLSSCPIGRRAAGELRRPSVQTSSGFSSSKVPRAAARAIWPTWTIETVRFGGKYPAPRKQTVLGSAVVMVYRTPTSSFNCSSCRDLNFKILGLFKPQSNKGRGLT